MLTLYEKIEQLCSAFNTSITSMCKEAGVSRASLSDLKMKRIKGLSTDTLKKIADYFGTTVDRLISDDLYETKADREELRKFVDKLEQKNNPPHANALADLDEPIKTIGYHEPEISPFIDVDALEAKKRREEKKASKQNEENKNDSELDELDKTMLSLFQSLSIIEKCEIITQLKKKST